MAVIPRALLLKGKEFFHRGIWRGILTFGFSYVCSICACLDLSVSFSSWCLGRAAVCDCDTHWTFKKSVCFMYSKSIHLHMWTSRSMIFSHSSNKNSQDPVVQSIVSLTRSLLTKMLTVQVSRISYLQVFFAEKKKKKTWEAFANAKAAHIFFSQNITVYGIYNDQSFNDTITNDIVSFEQLGLGRLLSSSVGDMSLLSPCKESLQIHKKRTSYQA